MAKTATAADILDQEFLEIRARLLQVAALLDRVDRAGGKVADDVRVNRIEKALAMLIGPGPGRVERIQLIFSREYDPAWKEKPSSLSSPAPRP